MKPRGQQPATVFSCGAGRTAPGALREVPDAVSHAGGAKREPPTWRHRSMHLLIEVEKPPVVAL